VLASVALRLPHRFGGHGCRHRLEQAGVGNPAWLVEIEEIRHLCPDDESGLRHAIDLARENVLHGTGRPFGAAVVDAASREVVAVGVDGVERLQDSVAHAEIVALLAAGARSGAHPRTAGCSTLYCSCEPCALCLTAILASGVDRVVYAARREDAVALGFDQGPKLPGSGEYLSARECLAARGITVEPGPLRELAANVMLRSCQSKGAKGEAWPA
jgi:tRNA(Arg) A34 adenosine deaminase TadA